MEKENGKNRTAFYRRAKKFFIVIDIELAIAMIILIASQII